VYLAPENLGHIITSIRFPTDANWDFPRFYDLLNDQDFVIYPGKVSNADCFRIGHIGRLTPSDTKALLVAVDSVCKEMKTAKYYN
jgi:2-aminoethylphosphonate-pyruvate transaminase